MLDIATEMCNCVLGQMQWRFCRKIKKWVWVWVRVRKGSGDHQLIWLHLFFLACFSVVRTFSRLGAQRVNWKLGGKREDGRWQPRWVAETLWEAKVLQVLGKPASKAANKQQHLSAFCNCRGYQSNTRFCNLQYLKKKVFKATVIRDLITIICLSIFAGEFAADVQSGSLCTYAFVSWQLKVCKAIRQLSSWRSLARMHCIEWVSEKKKQI